MSISLILILITSGLFVGFINTLSAGGTVISIALYLALGLSPASANATNRIGVLCQTFSASMMMSREGLIQIRKVLILSLPTVCGAIIGALLATVLNQEIFSYCLAFVLVLMVVFMFISPKSFEEDSSELLNTPIAFWKYIIFFFIGLYGGFVQVGTGFFLIMAGSLLIGYDIIKTNALKVSIMFIYTFFAIIVFGIEGEINWTYGLLHSSGSVIGSLIATKFAIKKGKKFIRWLLIGVIAITMLNLLNIINIQSLIQSLIIGLE